METKTKVISYSPARERELGQRVKFYCRNKDFTNLTIVEINDEGQAIDEACLHFLEVARTLASDPENIVILMNADLAQLKELILFRGLMTLPNVGFVSTFIIWNVANEYDKLVARNKANPDPTAHILFDFEQMGIEVAKLQKEFYKIYDATNTVEAKTYNSWHERARRAGFVGTDVEVVHAVTDWTPIRANYFSSQYLPGIFVDASGILFDSKGGLRTEIKEVITDIAKKTNRSVVVLVGSNDYFQKAMEKNGVTWRTLSKYAAKGAVLEFVISQESAEALSKIYGISVKELYRIPGLPTMS